MDKIHSLNCQEFTILLSEISSYLKGTIQQISPLGKYGVYFQIRIPQKTVLLCFNFTTEFPCFFIQDSKPTDSVGPSSVKHEEPTQSKLSFHLVLRKYLKGASIFQIELTEGERIIRLDLKKGDLAYSIFGEMFGRRPKFILTTLETNEILFVFPYDRKLSTAKLYQIKSSKLSSSDLDNIKLRDIPFQGKLAFNQYVKETYQQIIHLNRLRKVTQVIKKQLDKQKRTLKKVSNEYQASMNHLIIKREADLLNVSRHLIKKGASWVEVPDVFSDGQIVKVELKPNLKPEENIQLKYKQSSKLKRVNKVGKERIDKLDRIISTISLFLNDLSNLMKGYDYSKISELLFNAPLEIRKSVLEVFHQEEYNKIARKSLKATKTPYHIYRSEKDYIWVAKSAKGAEEMMRLAKGNDLWFHVVEGKGAHVIVPKPDKKKDINQQTIINACFLAIHYSDQKNNTKVEVHRGTRSDLIKKKGLPTGKFIIRKSKIQAITNVLSEILAILKNKV